MMYASAMNEPEPSVESSGGNPSFDEPAPNLEVIYQAFGEQADLYKDVLQVKPIATAEQIQMAYFDRRSELFALLASIDSEEEQDDITASHRFHAERKMDAVVMAVRILGDPHLRQEYDNVVSLRQQQQQQQMMAKKQPKEPPSSSASRSSSTREPDGVYAGLGGEQRHQPPDVPASSTPRRSPKRKSPKRRSRRVSPPDLDTSAVEDTKMPSSSSSGGTDDRYLDHHQYGNSHYHQNRPEPEYEFVNNSLGKASSKGGKHKKSHKKKHKDRERNKDRDHHDQHHSSYYHHHTDQQSDMDQSTLNRTINDEDESTNFAATVESSTAINYVSGRLNDETIEEDRTIESKQTWDDQATITSQSTNGGWTRDSRQVARGGTSTLSNITNSGIVSRIQEEVAGTVEDTLVSFEQVLNVFTLQERDILAVMGRIDKAKRQLRKRR